MSDSKMNMSLDDIIKTTNPDKEHGFNNKMKKKFPLNNNNTYHTHTHKNNQKDKNNHKDIIENNTSNKGIGNLKGNSISNGFKKFQNNKFAKNKFQTNNWNNQNSNKFKFSQQGRLNKFDEIDHKIHYNNNVIKIKEILFYF
jgi:hypothetical protein